MFGALRQVLRGQSVQQPKIKEKEKQTFKVKEWASGIKEEEPLQMHLHIYHFFITQGHYDLANTFAKEAKLQTRLINSKEIEERFAIKNLIKNNQIDDAITKIQQYEHINKDADRQQQLLFTLKSLKIINMIKQNKIQQAINQAKDKLLPYVKTKVLLQTTQFEWMSQIEKVMSLIAFVNEKQCKNKYLLSPSYKSKVADDVNSFLLGNKYEQSLKILLSLGKWCQKKLQNYANFPHINPWSYDLFNM